jgi:hypothetical protein
MLHLDLLIKLVFCFLTKKQVFTGRELDQFTELKLHRFTECESAGGAPFCRQILVRERCFTVGGGFISLSD